MRIIGLVSLLLALSAGAPAFAQPPLEALPMILRLQPSQMAAWRAYRDAEAMGHADATRQGQEVEALNAMQAPQRLDAMLDQMRVSEAALQRHAEATKAFYAVLSPEQKATFDQMTRLPAPPSPIRSARPARGLVPDGDRLRIPDDAALPPPAP